MASTALPERRLWVDCWPTRRTAVGTLGLSRCPIKSAIQRQTAHAAISSPLQELLQGSLLAGSSPPPKAAHYPEETVTLQPQSGPSLAQAHGIQ